MMVNFVVRLPEDLRKRARAVATLRGETLSQVVRRLLEEYVEEHTGSGRQQPSWEGDSIFNIIGIGQGGPADLSSDKYAYFTEALI